MCSRGVLVHYLSRLGATIAVLAAELPCGDGVSTKWALEYAKALHQCDGVMSHNLMSISWFHFWTCTRLTSSGDCHSHLGTFRVIRCRRNQGDYTPQAGQRGDSQKNRQLI